MFIYLYTHIHCRRSKLGLGNNLWPKSMCYKKNVEYHKSYFSWFSWYGEGFGTIRPQQRIHMGSLIKELLKESFT